MAHDELTTLNIQKVVTFTPKPIIVGVTAFLYILANKIINILFSVYSMLI